MKFIFIFFREGKWDVVFSVTSESCVTRLFVGAVWSMPNPYFIERMTKYSSAAGNTLSLPRLNPAISHRLWGMLYLCNVQKRRCNNK